ncbi:hypothetical protein KC19_2G185500 [Ceratodon purpureus]|uniref:Uncharacterized protein n=1 Tax=Ceratodon purpureus TaxID=3225 RepID=A0A8T0IWX7_CERPU|nr:hypothetical protein KC19_2G185500 [Ceratodon purpureus]
MFAVTTFIFGLKFLVVFFQVLRQLDADAQAIERELRLARAEIEAQELHFEDLRLKNLYPAPKPASHRLQSAALSKSSGKENVAITRPIQDFSSSYRQVLYGGLSLVIVSFIYSSISALFAGTWMRASKLASHGLIYSALLTVFQILFHSLLCCISGVFKCNRVHLYPCKIYFNLRSTLTAHPTCQNLKDS